MESYVLSIITAILLVGISNIILPEGKMGKFIKSIFSLIIVIVIISPVLNFINNKDFDEPVFQTNSTIYKEDYNYLDYIYFKRAETISNSTRNILENQGINSEVEIFYDVVDYEIKINKVKVNLQSDVITEDDKHIIISVVKQTVSEFLSIEKEIISVQ